MSVDQELIAGLLVAVALTFHCIACINACNTRRLPIIKPRKRTR